MKKIHKPIVQPTEHPITWEQVGMFLAIISLFTLFLSSMFGVVYFFEKSNEIDTHAQYGMEAKTFYNLLHMICVIISCMFIVGAFHNSTRKLI